MKAYIYDIWPSEEDGVPHVHVRWEDGSELLHLYPQNPHFSGIESGETTEVSKKVYDELMNPKPEGDGV